MSDNPGVCTATSSVRVALIDSGVQADHPWFAAARLHHRAVARAAGRWQVVASEPGDRSGHGTACAGILHRRAPFAEILSIRALGEDGRCSKSALVAAIAFAIEERVDVVSLSLGFDMPRRATLKVADQRPILSLYELADRAVLHNVVLVASGPNVSHFRTYPGRSKSLLGVGCCGPEDEGRICFRRTEDYDFVAPGKQVRAPAVGGGERLWTGTSFAVPAVAARVAVLRSEYPGLAIDRLRLLLPEDGGDVRRSGLEQIASSREEKREGGAP